MWRVGNGTTIRIWNENWLPDKDNPCVLSNLFPYLEIAIVSSLKDMQGVGWDANIIRDIFTERDAKLILSIPLDVHSREYKLIWAKEDSGIFTVKSCYRAIVQELQGGDIKEWTKIWKLKIPPKAKILFWQACSKCLPTAEALNQRKVDCPLQCQVCAEEDESTMHVFMKCEVAKFYWRIFCMIHMSKL